MDKQELPGLWAKADDVQRWRNELQKLREFTDALLNDLGDMQCFRISMASLGDETPAEAEAPVEAAKPSDEDPRAQGVWHDENGPIVDEHDTPEAKAYAEDFKRKKEAAKPAKAAKPAAAPAPEKAADGVKTRIRFPKFVKQLTEEHGAEVVNYAVKYLCPDDQTTAGLRNAMKGFLGVFQDAVWAGHAFAEAHGEEGLDAEAAVASLENAKHKLTDADGRVAVWSTAIGENEQPHVAPVARAAADVEPIAEAEVVADAEAEDVDVDNFLAEDEADEPTDDVTVELDDAEA